MSSKVVVLAVIYPVSYHVTNCQQTMPNGHRWLVFMVDDDRGGQRVLQRHQTEHGCIVIVSPSKQHSDGSMFWHSDSMR